MEVFEIIAKYNLIVNIYNCKYKKFEESQKIVKSLDIECIDQNIKKYLQRINTQIELLGQKLLYATHCSQPSVRFRSELNSSVCELEKLVEQFFIIDIT